MFLLLQLFMEIINELDNLSIPGNKSVETHKDILDDH
jgi:hypothetical protein